MTRIRFRGKSGIPDLPLLEPAMTAEAAGLAVILTQLRGSWLHLKRALKKLAEKKNFGPDQNALL
jgi:hypothetical protein